MSSKSGHASFIGLVDTQSEMIGSSEQWKQSLVRSESRKHAALRQFFRRPVLVAYRGDDRGYFQDGLHTVMLDGQIENLRDLATQSIALKGAGTVPDAELVAMLFSRHGESLFARLIGNFAMSLAMQDTGEVLLVRDRFGARQLFYVAIGSGWAWASEIKSLCPILDRVALDPEGLRQAIHYRYMTGETLIEGVNQVLPACFVRLAMGSKPVETHYWKFEFRPSTTDDHLEPWADRVDAGLDTCFARLKEQHRDIGILLSGGVDSSLLAAKAARSGFRTCVALTGKWSGENPELEWAIAVARHLGIEHQIVDIEDSYLEECFPWLVWRMEEPPRHYNSFVLAKLFEVASTRIGTLLSGHTADTMFGPLSCIKIDAFKRRHAQLQFIPPPIRMALAATLRFDGSMRAHRLKDYLQLDEHGYAKTLFKIRHSSAGARAFGRHFRNAAASSRAVSQYYNTLEATTERFQRFDLYTFVQTNMVVLDRLAAPFGICVEMPFLSPDIVNTALELPIGLKADRNGAKPVLKTLAARYFPKGWIYRTKQGFPTDTSRWLRGPLSRWTQILSEKRTASRGLLDISALQAADVGRDYETIWTGMCLEMFCRQFIDGEGGPQSYRSPE